MENSKEHKLFTLFRSFFVISAVTLGGGLAMLPVIQQEFTRKHPWINDDDMADVVAIAQSSPGIIAANIAVLTGYRIHGVWGAVVSLTGVAIPPFLSIIVIASLFQTLEASAAVNAVFSGVRAAVCALILAAVVRLYGKMVRGKFSLALAVAGFIGILFNMNAVILVILAGTAGIVSSVIAAGKGRKS